MTSPLTIRTASVSDAPALLSIYAPYVEKTAVTFEYTVPSPEEFQTRIAHTLDRYPYLVAERNREIIGYAYAPHLKREPPMTGLWRLLSMSRRTQEAPEPEPPSIKPWSRHWKNRMC